MAVFKYLLYGLLGALVCAFATAVSCFVSVVLSADPLGAIVTIAIVPRAALIGGVAGAFLAMLSEENHPFAGPAWSLLIIGAAAAPPALLGIRGALDRLEPWDVRRAAPLAATSVTPPPADFGPASPPDPSSPEKYRIEAGLNLVRLITQCGTRLKLATDAQGLIAECRQLAITHVGGVSLIGESPGMPKWRWLHLQAGDEHRVQVLALEESTAPGRQWPVFELRSSGLFVKRASRAAPGFMTTDTLRLADHARGCLLALDPAVRLPPNWVGAMPEIVDAATKNAGCSSIRLKRTRNWFPEDGKFPFNVSWSGCVSGDVMLWYRPRSDGPGFEILAGDAMRSYLLDSRGVWHAASWRSGASETDPAPYPCERDLTVACSR